MQTPELDILGQSGLKRAGGYGLEEFNPKLAGRRGAQVYRQMRDNDPIVGGVALAFESLIRRTAWYARPADESPEALAEAEFLESCLSDMSHSWSEFLAEVTGMLWYGWSYHEIVYKLRRGPDELDPTKRSDYTDGRFGWRKLPVRSQDSLERWGFQDDGGLDGMWQLAPPNYTSVFLPIHKALLFRTTSSKNNPEGRSLLRNAYRPWYYRTRLEEIEAIGVERDLAGVPHMQLPPEYLGSGAAPDKKAVRAEVEQMLGNLRNNEQAYLITPSETTPDGKSTGWKFSLITSGGKGHADPDVAIKRHRAELAMALLAEFILLGTENVGSFALSQTKTTLFGAVIGSVLDSIKGVLNRFAVPRLYRLNGVARERWATLEHADVATADVAVLATAVSSLLTSGGLTADLELENHLRATLKLPEKPEALEQESAETHEHEEDEDEAAGPDRDE